MNDRHRKPVVQFPAYIATSRNLKPLVLSEDAIRPWPVFRSTQLAAIFLMGVGKHELHLHEVVSAYHLRKLMSGIRPARATHVWFNEQPAGESSIQFLDRMAVDDFLSLLLTIEQEERGGDET